MPGRPPRRTAVLAATLLAAGVAGGCSSKPYEPATLILRGGNVVTMDPGRSVAQALAVRGNVIVAVGTDREMDRWIGPSTQVVELDGQTVLPGFVDTHIHLPLGATRLGKCSMDNEALTAAEIVARAQACIATDPGGPSDWFEIENVNPAGLVMTRADLDQVSASRPIMAHGIDGHTAWANTPALAAAGITAATPDPVGGVIVRDAEGDPTGSLLDQAAALVTSVIPPLTAERWQALTSTALELARSKGITTVQDAWASPEVLDVYGALEQSGDLRMRVRADLMSDVVDDEAEYTRLLDLRDRFASHPLVRADGVKIFSDGVIEYPTQTAALMKPYRDLDGNVTTNYGNRYFDPAVLQAYVTRLDREGFRVNVHSIGDYTTHALLDAFEQARLVNGPADHRHQISHLQIVDPGDLARFGDLGVFANMQLFWALPDVYSIDALQPFIDPAEFDYMYPAGSLKAAGATIIGGSDWPVDALPGDPMANTALRSIFMGVTRTNPIPGDPHYGEVLLEKEQVDRDTMIAAYTINAARGIGMEDEIGSIESGKLADLVVFDQDITSVPIESLVFEVDVAATIFDGQYVYTRPAPAPLRAAKGAGGPGATRLFRTHAMCGHRHD